MVIDVAKLLQNYVRFFSIRRMGSQEILKVYGDAIKEKSMSEQALATVLVCAWNEEHSLPLLLYSLYSNDYPLEVVVVDNNSSDKTKQVAEILGAKVIEEQKPGLIHALLRGINYLSDRGQINPILMTDADSFTQPNWAHSMISFAEKKLPEDTGGQIFAPLVFFGSLPRDSMRTAIALTLDYKFWRKGYSRPHGPNALIRPSLDGTLLEQVGQPLNANIVTGTDDFIHQRVRAAGGEHAFNFGPESVVFSNGDRYKSLRAIFRTYLDPEYRNQVYSEWHKRQPGGIRFSSKDRPKIGNYN